MATSVIKKKELSRVHVLHSDTNFGSFDDGTFYTNFSNFIRSVGGGQFLITCDTWTGAFILYHGWYDNGAGISMSVGIRPRWFQVVNGTFSQGLVGS